MYLAVNRFACATRTQGGRVLTRQECSKDSKGVSAMEIGRQVFPTVSLLIKVLAIVISTLARCNLAARNEYYKTAMGQALSASRSSLGRGEDSETANNCGQRLRCGLGTDCWSIPTAMANNRNTRCVHNTKTTRDLLTRANPVRDAALS
jgi:hypothetical protein